MSATALKSPDQLQWWLSAGAGQRAADIFLSSASTSSLPREVNWVSQTFRECALVVIRVPTIDRRTLHNVASMLRDAPPSPHICLAVDAGSSMAWKGKWNGGERVGLLLDKVDAHTPLADIADESIEALRIAPAFGEHAVDHLRSACVLDTILGLAHHIGLCTFGSPRRSSDAGYQFDYVPHPSRAADVEKGIQA